MLKLNWMSRQGAIFKIEDARLRASNQLLHLECKGQRLKMIFYQSVQFQYFKFQMSSYFLLQLLSESQEKSMGAASLRDNWNVLFIDV